MGQMSVVGVVSKWRKILCPGYGLLEDDRFKPVEKPIISYRKYIDSFGF